MIINIIGNDKQTIIYPVDIFVPYFAGNCNIYHALLDLINFYNCCFINIAFFAFPVPLVSRWLCHYLEGAVGDIYIINGLLCFFLYQKDSYQNTQPILLPEPISCLGANICFQYFLINQGVPGGKINAA